MADELMHYLESTQPQGFEPRPYYGAEEDSLTFYFDPAESYARRMDDLLTLFLALESNDLVGCQVKGVRNKLKRLGDFGIHIQHGKIRLGIFFHLLAYFAEKPEQRDRYLDLGRRAKDVEVEIDEGLVSV